jgi:hypothetical protein
MKLLFAVVSLWAVAVFALQGERARYRFSEVDERDVEPFRSGQTYKYRLDSQISSGMASVSEQHAVTRLQAEALFHFQSERLVSLKLNDVIVGTTNQEIQEPEKVQPMEMFKENQIKSEEARLLELPCTFDYVDGLVERIRFHQQDQPWSKNIKKSVLNMLQLNLKQRQGQNVELEQLPAWKQEREQESSNGKTETQQQSKMFVMPEITLEGECQVTYTLNKMNPSNKFNSYYDNELSRDDVKMFNVTKTVDFHRCNKIADIRYGPKIEKPCDNCTNPQELEERKLDRTTIMRHVVVGSQEKYGIKKVETVSHYIFKMLNVEEETPMHTIVASQLNYIRIEESRTDIERELRQVATSNKEESLLYSIEWDEQEKLFYMYGDDEFPQQSPFEKVQDKVGKVENLMKKLVGMWSDKVKGIDSEATLVYTRLIDVLRMCSQEELRQIFSLFKEGSSRLSETEQLKAEDILVDALSNAGTHNTIKVLVEKTLRKDIQPARATRALVQLKDLPAPSEKQIKILTDLCENEVCNRHGPCRQVCWLTVGTLMGDLCNQELTVQDAVEQKKPLCHSELKKSHVAKAMKQFNKLETRYEKIVLLKSLGNAGLDASVNELEKIIRDNREDPLVRMQAIDSLRRLRAVMPQKIQRVLLPVFQNVRERPEVRMMAVSQILATLPENPILDQIGFTLIREPSRQVKSFVYGAMKQLSQSPVEIEKELAQHLKALLKLANISEEDEETLVRGSRYHRIPVYSQAKKEGFFLDLESMVGTDNVLPKHISAGMDTIFNGLFQKNSLELSFTQEDVEQWFEKLMDVYMDYQYGQSSNSKKSSVRGYRSSSRSEDSSEADNDFRKIVNDLGIKRRSQQQRVDSDANSNNSPFAMFSIRYGDIDYAVLPLEEVILPSSLKKILTQGQQPTIRDLENLIEAAQGRPFRAQAALNILENSVKIPTSAGLPIRVWHVIPVLASIEGQVKPQFRGSELQAEVKIHPMVSITHLKRVEVWSPIVNSGVDSTRTVSVNLPLTSNVQIRKDSSKTFKWTVEVPQKQFRVLNFHTLPLTYTSEIEWTQQRTPVVKRIENKNLVQRAQHVEKVYGKHTFGMPLKVNGEVHIPHSAKYEDIVKTLMSTENHIHIEFQPTEETPNQIVLSAQGSFFQQSSEASNHRDLKGFHSKSRFDDEMSQYYEQDEDNERKFNKFLDDFEPSKMYKHNVQIQLETVGGRNDKNAQVEIEATSDSQHRYAKVQLKAKRSPLQYFDESNQWTMKAEAQVVLPEVHSSIRQYQQQQGEKQQKFVAQAQCEWGSEHKQKINLNINGQQARNQQWRKQIEEVERLNTPQGQKLRQQMIQKTAFINKYDISAEFEGLRPETKNAFNSLATLLKSWNFWNTKTELKSGRDSQQRDGQITATVVIDPMTHEHANITLKTPEEIVRIDSLSLPTKVKPFKLVKPGQVQKSVDSFSDIVRDYATEERQECKVNSRKVRSFDDVTFKAPLTKCYSVLAKDCGSEKPRFAVLLKKINNQEKALKVIANGDRIEVQPKDGKLAVKINGQHEQNQDTLQEYGIDYSKNLVRIANRHVTVRFDGEEASVKISASYKNTQCGLCGHYNDDSEDEFRMSNDELTSDLKSFHKSYSVVDDECREDLEETHRQQEYKQLKHSRNFDDQSEEDEQQQQRRRTNDNDETQPIEKTEVLEYNHKICFSVKPVKACPEDSYPQQTKEQKVGFTCLDRSSSEARQLLREARRSTRPVELPTNKPSFVETITVPSTCVVY